MVKAQYLCPLIFFLLLLTSCNSDSKLADLIIENANIHTMDPQRPRAGAIAIQDGKILAVGDQKAIQKHVGRDTRRIDARGNFLMPGFIEGHAHFSGLGQSLINLNFLKAKSWDEIVSMVAGRVETARPGEWIIGRGWHQEKWSAPPDKQVLGYPYHDALSAVSPDNPVMLSHASGHAVMANQAAMDLAGVTVETPDPKGGHIVRDEQGHAIGVFEENAEQIIESAYRAYRSKLTEEEKHEELLRGIRLAQEECLKKGITSFQDAGSTFREISLYEGMARHGQLDIRLWAMVRHGYITLAENIEKLPVIDAGDGHFTCRSIKAAVDGALGSYGAWLLRPYNDKDGFTGQNVMEISELEDIANLAVRERLQLCIHAIGDRGNREVLDIFENATRGLQDHRWRVEHAQHLHPADIPRFHKLGVIASMQGIHCTSDAPYVIKRLGEQRAREGAYVWRSLLDSGAVVTNGTDAPVEDIDPVESFYATVTRKRTDDGMLFFPEQKMSREEALYSYTMANAFAAFEEDVKGSLQPGKYADLVMLSNDLVSCTEDEILKTEVLLTMVGGEIKYSAAEWRTLTE